MVQRFRKKPVVVEAVQFMGENDKECIEFCPKAVEGGIHTKVQKHLVVPTNGTFQICNVGDYLIKDAEGEFSICNHDVFYCIYESADTPQSKTPIILFDRSIIPDGVSVDDFIEDINSGRPTGVFPPGGRSIKDVIAVINR
jgi:hypothetical protein